VVVRNKYDVLTSKELQRLKDWLRGCEAKNNPATNEDISNKVRTFLVARSLYNRKNHKNTNLEYLTKHEWDIVQGKEVAAQNTWRQRNLASDPTLKLKGAKAQDAKRAGKQREDVVDRHFNGEFGQPTGRVVHVVRQLYGCGGVPKSWDLRKSDRRLADMPRCLR